MSNQINNNLSIGNWATEQLSSENKKNVEAFKDIVSDLELEYTIDHHNDEIAIYSDGEPTIFPLVFLPAVSSFIANNITSITQSINPAKNLTKSIAESFAKSSAASFGKALTSFAPSLYKIGSNSYKHFSPESLLQLKKEIKSFAVIYKNLIANISKSKKPNKQDITKLVTSLEALHHLPERLIIAAALALDIVLLKEKDEVENEVENGEKFELNDISSIRATVIDSFNAIIKDLKESTDNITLLAMLVEAQGKLIEIIQKAFEKTPEEIRLEKKQLKDDEINEQLKSKDKQKSFLEQSLFIIRSMVKPNIFAHVEPGETLNPKNRDIGFLSVNAKGEHKHYPV